MRVVAAVIAGLLTSPVELGVGKLRNYGTLLLQGAFWTAVGMARADCRCTTVAGVNLSP